MRGATPPSVRGGTRRRAGAAAGASSRGVAARAGPTGREGRAADGDPTAATYAGTSGLPKLIVNGLTNAINAVLGPAADAGDWEAPEEGPAVTPAELKEGLRQDYEERNYLFTGKFDKALYARGCVYTDPTMSFQGLAKFEQNLANLGPIVEKFLKVGETTLYGIALDEKASTVTARWRMYGEFKAPWNPIIDIDGQTVFTYDPEKKGRVVDYRETWGTAPGEALAQLIQPAVRGPDGKRQAVARGYLDWIEE